MGSLLGECITDMLKKENIEKFLSDVACTECSEYGEMVIKCPAIRLLLKAGALNLDNISEYKYSMGCFHRVIVV